MMYIHLDSDWLFDYEMIDPDVFRMIIWTEGRLEFVGPFMTINAYCEIGNIIASDMNGNQLETNITMSY